MFFASTPASGLCELASFPILREDRSAAYQWATIG